MNARRVTLTALVSLLVSSGVLGLWMAPAWGSSVVLAQTQLSGAPAVSPALAGPLPEVVTGLASNVRATTATVNGTVNPNGSLVSTCEFEYGSEDRESGVVYAFSAPCSSLPGSGSAPVAVSAALHGLQPGGFYIFRLAATNANGTSYSRENQFIFTPPAVEGVSTGAAEELTTTGAKLTGSLSPDGTDAHYYFEYGPTTAYGSKSPAPPGTDAGSGGAGCAPPGGPSCIPVAAATSIGSLAQSTTYHYRLVAVDEFGTTVGEDREFKTLGPPRVSAEAEVAPASKAGQTTATLRAQVDPAGAATTYRFEYGETTSYGTRIPIPDGTLAAGHEPVSIPNVVASGLKVGTIYHYRIVASNEYGTTTGPDQQFTTLPAVLIDHESVAEVAATSATLQAQINSLGSDTHYYFQYGTTTSYTVSVPAAPGVDLGSAEADLPASVHLQGLAAGSTYHYRVVAVNEPEGVPVTIAGADRTFATQAAGTEITQPDGRQWELVSPPNKQGAGLIAIGNEQGADIQAAADGSGITYAATAPFAANPAGSRAIEVTQVISSRGAPGIWSTADISLPHNNGAAGFEIGHAAEYKLFSTELSLGFVEPPDDTPLPPLPANAERTIYMRTASGEYMALVTSANVPPGTKFGNTEGGDPVNLVGASPDLKHVVLETEVKLTGASLPPGGFMLYEWTAGELTPVSVLPGGESSAGSLGSYGAAVRHAVSNDGSRVIWGAYTTRDGNKPTHLYLRDMARGEDLAVDTPQGAPEPENTESHYKTANAEDSRVFFTSPNRLTADSTTAGLEDLYEFELTSGRDEPLAGTLHDLTVDHNVGESAAVQGVIEASEDGSSVYFVARGILGDGGEHGAVGGGDNLYVEHYDQATKAWAQPHFIATLSKADSPSWANVPNERDLARMTSRVSPNGRYLTFMSERSLTGYENRDASSGVPDEEVYLYDAITDRLVCASCNPTGTRPAGLFLAGGFDANLVDYAENWSGRWVAANIPGWTSTDASTALSQSRYLSDSGRLFFNSEDALVPADVNGKEDVYEYEPEGVGSCQGATHGQSASVVFEETVGGCVGLISSGTSTEESAFMGASESGGDVFFLTLSRLAPSDYDTSIDMYDAHECTASAPCAPPPPLTPPPCTTGDACKPGPTPQPALFGEPSSETFSGAGNVVPATPVKATTRSAGQARKLAKALKSCRKQPKRKRAACERRARSRYGAAEARRHESLSTGTGH